MIDEESKQIALALASQFRSDGEYWSGTPDHAAFQSCADRLLKAFGLTDDDRVQYDAQRHPQYPRFRVEHGMPWELMTEQERAGYRLKHNLY